MTNGIWVYAEQKGGDVLESSLEVVCEGRRLADQTKTDLTVVMFGRDLRRPAATLGEYGANHVRLGEREEWILDQPEEFAAILSALIQEHGPAIILFPSTAAGEEVASRVAARLRVAVASRCDRLQLGSDGILLQTRLAYENRVHLTVSCANARPQMATVVPGAMKVKKTASSREPLLMPIDPALCKESERRKTTVVGFIKADPASIDISDATVIVAGGKGVGGPDGFTAIAELAQALGGAVAGSRMAVDAGYIGKERQIGQSGKSVAPDLLISCGISGANAHTIGMRDARTVVAINRDKTAPMMKLADLGVVGDFHDIAPLLVERLRSLVPQPQTDATPQEREVP